MRGSSHRCANKVCWHNRGAESNRGEKTTWLPQYIKSFRSPLQSILTRCQDMLLIIEGCDITVPTKYLSISFSCLALQQLKAVVDQLLEHVNLAAICRDIPSGVRRFVSLRIGDIIPNKITVSILVWNFPVVLQDLLKLFYQ